MDNAISQIPAAERSAPARNPSLLSANLLYLLSMVLLLLIGSPLQQWSLGWGLIAGEALLILLPTLLFIRIKRLSVRQTLRLRWPGWRMIVLSAVISAGIWPLSIALNAVMTLLLGYTPSAPAGWTPVTPGQAILFFAAVALAAPLCEEPFWRGYMQSAYEGRRPWLGMLMVSLFFAFWHMRFQGFLALLPISLVLGFLTWRSQSLLPAMVAHFITNGLQCAVVIANGLNSNPSAAVSQSTALVLGIMIIAGFCLGIPAAAGGLFLVWRLTAPATKGAAGQPETMAPEALVEKPSPRPRAIYFLPLLGVFAIYLFAAAMEVIDGRFPQYLPLKDMKLQTAPWSEPVAWKYELRNAAEQPVGQMECTLTPEADAFVLSCARQTTAYEIHLGNSHYYGADSEEEATYEWERSSLNLISAEVSASFKAGGENRLSVTRQGDSLSLLREDSGTRITHTFALNSLLEGEWPWRLCALPFGSRFNGARAWLTWPLRWQQDTQSSAPLTQQVYFLARGKDTVKTPAGDFQAWRVELRLAGSNELQTAWYAVDAPHTLVKYNNGSETMLLVEGMTP